MPWFDRVLPVARALKYTLIYPAITLAAIETYYFMQEQKRISAFMRQKYDGFITETQEAFEQTSKALKQFTSLTAFPSIEEIQRQETRNTLRTQCISNGVSPQVYNNFYAALEKTEKGTSLNAFLEKECEKNVDRCEAFASVAQLLLSR